MYVTELSIREFRCIARTDIDFLHPDSSGADRLELPNVNLLTGLNGGGKSTVLKAVVAAALGKRIERSEFATKGWVRRGGRGDCRLRVGLLSHPTDEPAGKHEAAFGGVRPFRLAARVRRRTEVLVSEGGDSETETATDTDAGERFFLCAYGPNRQTRGDRTEVRSSWINGRRLQRVASLLDEHATLEPLETWLPICKRRSRDRFAEIVKLLGRTMPPSTRFTDRREGGAYLFEHDEVAVPYGALSEGIRSHIAWIADLLFHLHEATPKRMSLEELPGIVLVDEIDLRLHPRWQLDVLSWVSAAFPRLQFLVTSHSPLLTGGLRPANIAVLEPDKDADGTGARARSVTDDVFGRSADGVLTSSYFDLASTRADPFRKHLRELVKLARSGDEDAPLQLMRVLGDPTKMKATGKKRKRRRR